MSIVTQILWDIAVQPLVYLIELVYSIFWRFTDSPGIAIIGVSIAVNLLCLPLYRMADDVQERERQKQASMERWVTHIKKHFSGDEQYMMLSAYYQEQGYRPIQALVGSISLVLQIPFFMAAYNYLSNLTMLKGSSFLFLHDLGNPDAMFTVGGFVVNVMPVAMTLLNCASTIIYTRGRPLRDKLQAYILAGLFLVLLYDSPSGLVFYWTCNQIFSLAKNIFMKVLKDPRTWALVIEQVAVCAVGFWLAATGRVVTPKMMVVGVAALLCFEALWMHSWRMRHVTERAATGPQTSSATITAQFLLASLVITLLMGVLVPSAVMGDSPTEFLDTHDLVNPLTYVVHATSVWGGVFVIWLGTYFFLTPKDKRAAYSLAGLVVAGVCLVDYFAFGSGLGTISTTLVYDQNVHYTATQQLANLAAVAATVVVLALVWKRRNNLVAPALAVVALSLAALSVPNLLAINGAYQDARTRVAADDSALVDEDGEVRSILHLSRTGNNVMIIFLDRAISGYLPYIMNERPELEAKFDGFTYYPNTLSFGGNTNFGSPALYGGYEYTPTAMNARADETLASKHDEALLVLPTLFSQAGYQSTIVNPPYAGTYANIPDLSIYDGLDDLEALDVRGAYTSLLRRDYGITSSLDMNRTFAMHGLFKAVPEFARGIVYDNGNYLTTETNNPPNGRLLNQYSVLEYLTELTEVTDGEAGFVQLCNETTHEPDMLQLPDYLPGEDIDNEGLEDMARFTLDGVTVRMDNDVRLGHYHVNIASMLKLGEYFDWMREQGVYDNTRIIVVADHGRGLTQFEGWQVDDILNVESVNPLLLVKDFDAHGFETDDAFMTNGDVPTIALAGIVDDPVNPATGVAINSAEKTAHDQIVTGSVHWNTGKYRGNTFDTSDSPWYSVHDDIFDLSNWTVLEGDE